MQRLFSERDPNGWCAKQQEHPASYLGGYTHKIAISNHRIQSVEAGAVHFVYKDYRDTARKKTMQLPAMEFTRRFTLHILPKGFVRIRHYGILSSTRKIKDLPVIHEQLKSTYIKKEKQTVVQICAERLNYDIKMCPCCKQQAMGTIMEFDYRGPPPQEWIQLVNKTHLTTH